jgi:hypothetical protein
MAGWGLKLVLYKKHKFINISYKKYS